MKNIQKLILTCFVVFYACLSLPSFAADTVWIDVRSEKEYKAEHLDGTEFIPHTQIGEQIGKLNLAKDTPIKLFCRSGGRAGVAEKTLLEMGYTNVENVGGIADAKNLMSAE